MCLKKIYIFVLNLKGAIEGLTGRHSLYKIINRFPKGGGLVTSLVKRIPGLGIPNRKVRVPTVFGTDMLVNPSDNSLEYSVYIRGVYEIAVTSFMLSVLPRVRVFWDVGAHVGYYTLLGSHFISSGGRVFAFEPHPRVFTLLKENVMLFGKNNVSLLKMGLSDRDCEKEIFDQGENVTRAPTFVEGIYKKSGHKCQLRSGDSLLSSGEIGAFLTVKPDIIKIDIEGYEGYALMGMTNLLSSSEPPILIFELNRRFDANQRSILESLMSFNNYKFLVENKTNRYPIKQSLADGPISGFIWLDLNNIPYQCNVLAYCEEFHAPLLNFEGLPPEVYD